MVELIEDSSFSPKVVRLQRRNRSGCWLVIWQTSLYFGKMANTEGISAQPIAYTRASWYGIKGEII